jgi:uncharacterized protein YdaU (DUF1376 family)
MGNYPWVKFYPGDWLAGTGALTAAERGVYTTLIMLMYEKNGSIAPDHARLARRCGLPKARFTKALEALIQQGKIFKTAGGLMNARCERELVERASRSQVGQTAAAARWKKDAGGRLSDEPAGVRNSNSVGLNSSSKRTQEIVEIQSPSDANASELFCRSESESELEPESESSSFQSSSPSKVDSFAMIWEAAGFDRPPTEDDRRVVEIWCDAGISAAEAVRAIYAVIARRGGVKQVRSLSYFSKEVLASDAGTAANRATKISEKLSQEQSDRILAARIMGTDYVPASACTPTTARRIIDAKLATWEKCRERNLV